MTRKFHCKYFQCMFLIISKLTVKTKLEKYLQWTKCDESNIEGQNFNLTNYNTSHCACVARNTMCTCTLNLNDIVRTTASATNSNELLRLT